MVSPSIDLTPVGRCLPAGASAAVLLGGDTIAAPTGDLSAYVPVKELAAYESVIIQLGPTN